MKRTPELKTQKAHELYEVRRRQRDAALEKVIRQKRIVDAADKFFDKLEEFGDGVSNGIYNGVVVPNELYGLAAATLDEEQETLDELIDTLCVAHKLADDAQDALLKMAAASKAVSS